MGHYVIKVTPPAGYTQSGDPDGCSFSPGLTCTTPNETTVTVNNAPVTDQNFGYYQDLGSISGSVCDGDGDGLCENGEAIHPDVTVTLHYAGPDGILGTGDDVTTPTTTDTGGGYSFNDLLPGLYQITITTPTGSSNLADADGGNPNNITVILANGEDRVDRDFELVATLNQLELDKTADPMIFDEAGDLISYSYKLTNTGTSNLYAPYSVSDDKTTVDCSGLPSILPPGASVTCTATYTITAQDLIDGSVTNTATATAKDGIGADVTSNQDSTTVSGFPDLTVTKTNNAGPPLYVGAPFTWTITVSNAFLPASFAETQVVLSDSLPAGATYTNLTGPTPAVTGLTCAIDLSNVITCTAGAGRGYLASGFQFHGHC